MAQALKTQSILPIIKIYNALLFQEEVSKEYLFEIKWLMVTKISVLQS